MTSSEKIEKINYQQFMSAKSNVEMKLFQARKQKLFTVSDEHFKAIVAIAAGAVEASYNKSKSTFARVLESLIP